MTLVLVWLCFKTLANWIFIVKTILDAVLLGKALGEDCQVLWQKRMKRFGLRPCYWGKHVINWNFCEPGCFFLSFVIHPSSSTQGWIYPLWSFWGPLRAWAFRLNQGKWKHVSICTSCLFFLLALCEKVTKLNIVLGANNKCCLTLMQTCVATSLVWGWQCWHCSLLNVALLLWLSLCRHEAGF